MRVCVCVYSQDTAISCPVICPVVDWTGHTSGDITNTQRERFSGLSVGWSDSHSLFPHTPRPGITRLSFPYFMSHKTVDYIITAVAMTAKHGWKLLPQVYTCTCIYNVMYMYACIVNDVLIDVQYKMNPETGMFCHHDDHPSRQRQWLSSVSYQSGIMTIPPKPPAPPTTCQVSSLLSLYHSLIVVGVVWMGCGGCGLCVMQESLLAAERLFQEAASFRVSIYLPIH